MAREIAILFGLLLLLPGACALGFMGLSLTMLPGLGPSDWKQIGGIAIPALLLWGVCFAISYGGFYVDQARAQERRGRLNHAVQASTGAPTAATFARLASTSFSAARNTSFTPWAATADRSSGGGRLAPGAIDGP